MLTKCIICGNEFEANSANENICPSCRQAAAGDSKPSVAKKESPIAQDSQLFKSTQCFVDLLNEKNWNFRIIPHNADRKNDKLIIPMGSKNLPSIPIQVFFNPDEERVAMYAYNIHTVASDKLILIPNLICDLQNKFIFARWALDNSDNTLQAEWYGHVTCGPDTGAICLSGVQRLTSVVDDCFPIIMRTMYALPSNPSNNNNGGSGIVS
ncbi:MAG: hypothetical protein IJ419_10910 [Agathobacter sp.]|nr:hypothetical protein [Agathobacter sp.]